VRDSDDFQFSPHEIQGGGGLGRRGRREAPFNSLLMRFRLRKQTGIVSEVADFQFSPHEILGQKFQCGFTRRLHLFQFSPHEIHDFEHRAVRGLGGDTELLSILSS